MKLYNENKNYKLYQGNMLDMLEVIDKESIDSIVTDPPYGLTSITKRFGKEGSAPASTKNNDGSFARLSKGFMGKEWDGSGIEYNIDTWKKCFEVLKPGGYLLAFGGSRTFHRIACAIEDAGFEIRDTIMWLYGSGFPKSMNIGLAIDKKNGVESKVVGIKEHCKKDFKENNLYAQDEANKNNKKCFGYGTEILKEAQNEWKGWGTCLKPSFEPIIVARKPFKGSLVDNVIENGVGGINIDECRVGNEERFNPSATIGNDGIYNWDTTTNENEDYKGQIVNGRFPANTILTYDETDFDEVCGGFPNTKSGSKMSFGSVRKMQPDNCYKLGFTQKEFNDGQNAPDNYGDSGSASRYFYCAKASKKDRDEGLDNFEEKQKYYCDGRGNSLEIFGSTDGGRKPLKNIHPTVKPTTLMQYLVRLVTPNNGTILDPFNGSGSTGKAVMYENKERNKGYKYIGIELTEEYLPIAQARIEYVYNLKKENKPQTNIFDYIGDSNE